MIAAKRMMVLVLLIGLLTACGPNEQELQQTAQAETQTSEAATQAAIPTATLESTATPTTTPTLTPTPEPTLTPTMTPEPEPAVVYGNVQVILLPYKDNSVVPDDLGNLTANFKLDSDEDPITAEILGPNGDLSVTLPAGTYKLSKVEIGALGVGAYAFSASLGVPETGCIYFGKLVLTYYRLPPVPLMDQVAMAQEIAKGENVVFVYMESGGIVPLSATLEMPDPVDRTEGSEKCEVMDLILDSP
jgi:hypothetical protein